MVHFGGDRAVETPIFLASMLQSGLIVRGPAIIEEATTTIVVYPGNSLGVSGAGNYTDIRRMSRSAKR